MKTFEITIDNILIHFVGSKLGLYVSFLIPLYMRHKNASISQKEKWKRMDAFCNPGGYVPLNAFFRKKCFDY